METQQFVDSDGNKFAKNVGSILQNRLNGVKQTADLFAKLYGLDLPKLQAAIHGRKAPSKELLKAFASHGPLRVGDLYDSSVRNKFPLEDDTKDGVVYMSAEQTEKTQRTTQRGEESKVPFYIYGDGAMSKTSLFRPEWIQELFVHKGVGDAPAWAFNKGHFEHQVTYFVGPVNFHWIHQDGKQHVSKMSTGDTNYITPFVPHTFTTRDAGNGLILAVTYGGSISSEEFQNKMSSSPFEEWVSGLELPSIDEPLTTDKLGGVLVNHMNDARSSKNGYVVKQLMASVPFQPHTKAMEYYIEPSNMGSELDIKVPSERWGYNIGSKNVKLVWFDSKLEQVLEPGSSFFIKPNIAHAFVCMDGEPGKLLIMEIQPESGDTMQELAVINKYSGNRGLKRIHSENTQWY